VAPEQNLARGMGFIVGLAVGKRGTKRFAVIDPISVPRGVRADGAPVTSANLRDLREFVTSVKTDDAP